MIRSFICRIVKYLISSEHLHAEDSDEEANPNIDSGDDLDDDNKEAKCNSRVLAYVELAQTVREFDPYSGV